MSEDRDFKSDDDQEEDDEFDETVSLPFRRSMPRLILNVGL